MNDYADDSPAPDNGDRTGSPPGMLQDDSRKMSQALASKPDARLHVREAAAAIRAQAAAQATPTHAQLISACMTYRHDFGLMGAEEQKLLRLAGWEWLRAWEKEGLLTQPPPETMTLQEVWDLMGGSGDITPTRGDVEHALHELDAEPPQAAQPDSEREALRERFNAWCRQAPAFAPEFEPHYAWARQFAWFAVQDLAVPAQPEAPADDAALQSAYADGRQDEREEWEQKAAQPEAQTLPLPEPHWPRGYHGSVPSVAFTKDQVQAYGDARAREERELCAKVCDFFAGFSGAGGRAARFAAVAIRAATQDERTKS